MSSHQERHQDAAAMDALNIDDLFLDGDDNVAYGGRVRSRSIGGGGGDGGGLGGIMGDIFTDMDFDLGDIMEGIIGDEDEKEGGKKGKASSVNASGGEAMNNDFDDSRLIGSAYDVFMGNIDFDDDSGDADVQLDQRPRSHPSRRRSSVNIDSMVGSSSPSARRARTARANPHLAMLEQQQKLEQQHLQRRSSTDSIKQEVSSLMAGSGGGGGVDGKRRRRKSKKFGIDYDYESNEDEESGIGEDAVAGDSGPVTKKTRRASNSPKIINRHHRQGEAGEYYQSLQPQSSAAAIHHQQQQYQQQPHQTQHQLEEYELKKQQMMAEIKKSFCDHGLPSSRSKFFPYMNLPNEVEIKKRGQRSYPCLERISNSQSGHGNDAGLTAAAIDANTRSTSTCNENSTNDLDPATTTSTTSEINVAIITEMSPIYELFRQYIGVVDTKATTMTKSDNSDYDIGGGGGGIANQQQHQYSPSSNLIASLTKSTHAVHGILQNLRRDGKKKKKAMGRGKKKKKDRSELEQCGDQEQNQKQRGSMIHHSSMPSSSSETSPQQLIDDLTNLYSAQIRQAAFLRQNLMNMEGWCEDHFKEDMQASFPVRRGSVEKVLQLLWAHRVNSNGSRMIAAQHDQDMEGQKQPQGVGSGGGERAINTNFVTTANPLISIKVKVKMPGYREKPGVRLMARLACPKRWRVALKRAAKNYAAATTGVTRHTPISTDFPKLDLSFADRETLEAVANEELRLDLVPKTKTTITSTRSADAAPTTKDSVVAINEVTVKNTLTESILPMFINEPVAAVATKATVFIEKKDLNSIVSDRKEVVKKKTKRIHGKLNKDIASAAGHPPSSASTLTGIANKKTVAPTPLLSMPYIPGYHQIPNEDNDKEDVYRKERHRLALALYGSILKPTLSPTERRSILANEISLTMTRLKKQHEQSQKQARASSNSTRYSMETINKQILDLQSAYLEDLEIMPETCSTTGLWNYMTKSNYFDVLEKEEDAYTGLEWIYQPEGMTKLEVDGYDYWGRLSPTLSARLLVKPSESDFDGKEDGSENPANENVTENGEESSSPIYERLQSLLVEEDDWSTSSDIDERDGVVSDEDDNDDNNLLATLPRYSPEDFVHGPKKHRDVEIEEEDSFADDNATLDISSLTLDQRTYIQLCAAGLVDGKMIPFFDVSSSLSSSSNESPPFAIRTFSDDDDDDEPIDDIVQKMMAELSTLNAETNARVATLQRMVLSHVNGVESAATTTSITSQTSLSLSTCQRHKDEENNDETLILSKYKQLEKHQKKEKQRQDIRTSRRVKSSGNKFDEEEWLPR
ncbi:hypothetical protein ACHAW5_009510 [Stephanodiscus triporus]|uniref:Uncharacterized protein n=1 Tax=Stephanodiscus triporus TaxID=2934178 RepID=A0ABD3N9R2_9STRA